MADTITTQLTTNAVAGVKRAKGDQGEVEQHSLPDQIAAAKFANSQRARVNPFKCIKRTSSTPPNSLGV